MDSGTVTTVATVATATTTTGSDETQRREVVARFVRRYWWAVATIVVIVLALIAYLIHLYLSGAMSMIGLRPDGSGAVFDDDDDDESVGINEENSVSLESTVENDPGDVIESQTADVNENVSDDDDGTNENVSDDDHGDDDGDDDHGDDYGDDDGDEPVEKYRLESRDDDSASMHDDDSVAGSPHLQPIGKQTANTSDDENDAIADSFGESDDTESRELPATE